MYFDKNKVISNILSYPVNQHEDKPNDSFNIAYGIDKNFLFGCMISISSVLLHNPSSSFHFHVFTDYIDQDYKEKIEALAKQYDTLITVYLVDCQELKNLPNNKNWTYAIYFRFIITDYFDGILNKILYLDADIICKNSLNELFDLDLSNDIAAVVTEGERDWWNRRAQDLKSLDIERGYFNSGVLFINLAKWNAFDVTLKAMNMLGNEEYKKIISFPDQDILNIILSNYVLFLDKRYNRQFSINYELKAKKGTSYKHPIDDETIFIHYIGPTKPWHRWAEEYSCSSSFIEAKKCSPWRNATLLPAINANQYRYCAKHQFHQGNRLAGLMSYLRYYKGKLIK